MMNTNNPNLRKYAESYPHNQLPSIQSPTWGESNVQLNSMVIKLIAKMGAVSPAKVTAMMSVAKNNMIALKAVSCSQFDTNFSACKEVYADVCQIFLETTEQGNKELDIAMITSYANELAERFKSTAGNKILKTAINFYNAADDRNEGFQSAEEYILSTFMLMR